MKHFSIFIFALFTTFNCFAQNPTLLWRIECDSCPGPSYLFGTNHNITGSYIGEHPLLENLAFAAEAIATESERAQYKAVTYSNDAFQIQQVPLHKLLDSADYKMVRDSFSKYFRVPFDSVEYMNPLALEVSFSYVRQYWADYYKKPKQDSIFSVPMDESFKKIAIGRNIPLTALDEPGSLSRMKNKEIPLAEQAQMLMTELKDTDYKRLYQIWDSCYRANDFNCLCNSEEGINTCSRPGDSILIYKRNMLWMQKIPSLINNHSMFIAVGSLHLCGNSGLVNLLRKKGYKLTPMVYD